MLRFLTAGESHGPGLVTVVEGLPAGLPVTAAGLSAELARRRRGHGRGRRMALEADELEILGGVRFGRTLGGPVAVLVRNSEWPEWQEVMAPAPGAAPAVALTTPRPGHADLAGMLKYDTHDARDILERASARETAARTIAGALAQALLATAGVSVLSHVVAIGKVAAGGRLPEARDRRRIDRSPVRCLDREAAAEMVAEIDRARRAGDTLGGVVEVLAFGVPAGLGSHVHWDRRLDAALAAAVMSIPGIMGVEVGDGFALASRPGSEAHDGIGYSEGGFVRSTTRAGGIEGGMSTGQVVRLRAAMKPLSTLRVPADSVDAVTKRPARALRQRSDTCAVPAAGVVAEQMVAWVLAAEMARSFGGDTVADFSGAVEAYRRRLAGF
ncbi:MAG: chorismate synthase [Acidimicrobiia bacterium]|nr:chorismate synthase [Acidimicrobiia bacterium]